MGKDTPNAHARDPLAPLTPVQELTHRLELARAAMFAAQHEVELAGLALEAAKRRRVKAFEGVFAAHRQVRICKEALRRHLGADRTVPS